MDGISSMEVSTETPDLLTSNLIDPNTNENLLRSDYFTRNDTPPTNLFKDNRYPKDDNQNFVPDSLADVYNAQLQQNLAVQGVQSPQLLHQSNFFNRNDPMSRNLLNDKDLIQQQQQQHQQPQPILINQNIRKISSLNLDTNFLMNIDNSSTDLQINFKKEPENTGY